MMNTHHDTHKCQFGIFAMNITISSSSSSSFPCSHRSRAKWKSTYAAWSGGGTENHLLLMKFAHFYGRMRWRTRGAVARWYFHSSGFLVISDSLASSRARSECVTLSNELIRAFSTSLRTWNFPHRRGNRGTNARFALIARYWSRSSGWGQVSLCMKVSRRFEDIFPFPLWGFPEIYLEVARESPKRCLLKCSDYSTHRDLLEPN